MALRLPVSVALACVVTFGLFWAMQALIGASGELQEGSSGARIEFVRLKRDRTPEVKKREPPKREKPEQQPPPPEIDIAKNMNPGDAVGDIMPMADTGVELEKASSLGAAGGDRDVVPLVRVDPVYPAKAEQRQIRGWVEIVFTIGPTGRVQDSKVVRAQPPNVFERAALRAIRRWRYNPKIVDGVAVSQVGIGVRFTFAPPRS